MSREWQQYPSEFPLETKLGTFYFSITDRDHIYADASSNGKYVTVNRVKLAVSAHLYRRLGDNWTTRDTKGWDSISASRHSSYPYVSYNHSQASSAARKKIREVLCEAVTEWAREHPELFDEAAAADTNNKLLSLERQLAEKQAEVAEIERQIAVLREVD